MSGERITAIRSSLVRLLTTLVEQWRRLTVGGLMIAAFSFAFSVGTDWKNMGTTTCKMEVMQPWLSDTCGRLGFGERPRREERLSWQSRRPGSCEDVRRYIDSISQGQYRGTFRYEAIALLAAKRSTISERFVPGTRLLRLYVIAVETAAANEALSRAKTMALAQDQSARECRAFAQTTMFKFVSAEVDPQRWQCDASGGGVACSMEGQSVCHLLERQTSEAETCGR